MRTPFEQLVAESYEPLQRYLRRRTDHATADDVLGDSLLVMWRRHEEIPEDARLAWCYGVARGCLANAIRSAERRLRLVRRLAAERSPSVQTVDPLLQEALDALPAKDAEVLRLWAWEQLTASEIATALDITPNAASIRLHRATKKLKAAVLRGKNDAAVGQPVGRRRGEKR